MSYMAAGFLISQQKVLRELKHQQALMVKQTSTGDIRASLRFKVPGTGVLCRGISGLLTLRWRLLRTLVVE